ncbi:hypothetical protein AKJ16_DCAP03436 [Drosera capensis]
MILKWTLWFMSSDYFSPLIKSIWGGAEFDHIMIEEDLQEHDNFIEALESRFLFLAADARSTLRGWRPSYRNVLLDVRKKLNVPFLLQVAYRGSRRGDICSFLS